MKTCLVVDDSRVTRLIARHMLEALEFAVDEAEDGRAAMHRCIAGAPPDVILLDRNMPVMDGIEFLHELDASDVSPRPKIVLCTVDNGLSHIRAAIAAGADEYVMKPFDRATLADKLRLVGFS